jgi:hypothetical protein
VYTEDPEESSRLLHGQKGGYSAVPLSLRLRSVMPPPPAILSASADARTALQGMPPSQLEGLTYLHERTSPAGDKRIVLVCLHASRQTQSDNTKTVDLWTKRELRALVLKPNLSSPGGLVAVLWEGVLEIEQPVARRTQIPYDPSGGTPPRAGEVFRLLAGRSDASDPSRLLIDYTLDGKPGTIAMTLQNDDRLRIDPDRGAATIEQFDTRGGRLTWTP